MSPTQRKPSAFPQGQLPLGDQKSLVVAFRGVRKAIEDENFPFEFFSDTAEAESWRKEVHRPIYHVHKWWARRLGSVFRAIVIGSLAPAEADVLGLFYQPVRFTGSVVMDPFMGSGTTLGESLKLGARVIGRDINPVSHFLVRNALGLHDRRKIEAAFAALNRDIAPLILHSYRTIAPDGSPAQGLYYFWVKQLPCPVCKENVDLFSSRIFARHAYTKTHPECQTTCPRCGDVNCAKLTDDLVHCSNCEHRYDPHFGPARGQKASCPSCQTVFSISRAARSLGCAPNHRLYAKLILTKDGKKVYLPASHFDIEVLHESSRSLLRQANPFPVVKLRPGYNTDQAITYGYRFWSDFFNDRQLLNLSILSTAISGIEDLATRELMTCLFSGTLEFNNMFASYKGEGTGAVRHMFAHHILKPERAPLEANIWGTPSSSGSFSTLYESRINRALNYADAPTEIRVNSSSGKTEKVSGLSEPMGSWISESFLEFEGTCSRTYLSCGDSCTTDVPDKTVDVIITDPPFFDNVHYSELADFFHVWQRHILGNVRSRILDTTRVAGEVQDQAQSAFTGKLAAVFCESHRVLRDDGLLVFTYHHSRNEGWRSVLEATMMAGFFIVACHPIKAEMSVAMPKTQARDPIDLDIIVVCKKASKKSHLELDQVPTKAADQIARLRGRGRKLSRNDVRIIVMAQALRCLSTDRTAEHALSRLAAWEPEAEILIASLAGPQRRFPDGASAHDDVWDGVLAAHPPSR